MVKPGDKIDIVLDQIDSMQQTYPASRRMPDVIYEDDNLLIINKKKGQKTHPNLNETDTALNDCATYLGSSPYIVHRLDMLTGGLLLVAKNPAVVPILNRELTTKTFHREYLAKVIHADKLKKNGTIDLPIGQDPDDQRKRMVNKTGLHAVTHYELLKKYSDNTALVKLTLETGRTHQIRVHMAYIGHPLLGDPKYGTDKKGRVRGSFAIQGQALHSMSLELTHPVTGERMKFHAPMPEDMEKLIEKHRHRLAK